MSLKMTLDNGVEVTPLQFEDIKFIIDKRDIADVLSIEQDSLTFADQSKVSIQLYITNYGYFKGIPVTITLSNNVQLKYFLDPSDEPIFTEHDITLKLKKRFENLDFWELAEGSTFDLLKTQYNTNYDYKIVKRVIYRTDIETQILTVLNTFFQIRDQIQDLIASAKRVYGDGINAVGLEPIKLAASILYYFLMISMLVTKLLMVILTINFFLQRIQEIILPTPQGFIAPQIKSLIIKSANALGYTVVSSLLDEISDLYYIGIPTNRTSTSLLEDLVSPMANLTTLDHPTYSDRRANSKHDYTTFGGFLRWFKDSFNARVQIVGNVIYIERRDVRVGVTNGITSGVTIQERGVSQYRPNTKDAWSRFLLSFPIDEGDQYTSDIWSQSIVEYQTINNNNATNSDINTIRGIRKIDMTFSLGFRKDKFSGLEKLAESFVSSQVGEFLTSVLDAVSNAVNLTTGLPVNIINPLDQLSTALYNRQGMLVTSDHYYTRPKILCLTGGGRIKNNWADIIGAQAIFNKYHDIDFIGNNDFLIHDNEIAECNDDIFINLQNNDFAEINLQVCEVLIATYQPFTRKAEISYKEPSSYANTVKMVKL